MILHDFSPLNYKMPFSVKRGCFLVNVGTPNLNARFCHFLPSGTSCLLVIFTFLSDLSVPVKCFYEVLLQVVVQEMIMFITHLIKKTVNICLVDQPMAFDQIYHPYSTYIDTEIEQLKFEYLVVTQLQCQISYYLRVTIVTVTVTVTNNSYFLRFTNFQLQRSTLTLLFSFNHVILMTMQPIAAFSVVLRSHFVLCFSVVLDAGDFVRKLTRSIRYILV